MKYQAEDVWSLAVAIDRVNGGYYKNEVYSPSDDGPVLTKDKNKAIMKRFLAVEDYAIVTEEDRSLANEIRNYFKSYLLKEISGTINDFEKEVLRIAEYEEFSNRDLLQFAIISCLPSTYRRDQDKLTFKKELLDSEPIKGEVGDQIAGDLIIVKCFYKENYNRFKIIGRFGESFVDFWFKEELKEGSTVKIKGKIKAHREDNSTQLNYVKIIILF